MFRQSSVYTSPILCNGLVVGGFDAAFEGFNRLFLALRNEYARLVLGTAFVTIGAGVLLEKMCVTQSARADYNCTPVVLGQNVRFHHSCNEIKN